MFWHEVIKYAYRGTFNQSDAPKWPMRGQDFQLFVCGKEHDMIYWLHVFDPFQQRNITHKPDHGIG